MELLESVAPEDVPEEALSMRSRPTSGWPALVQRALDDHRAGQVTHFKVKDQDEYKKMRNGTQNYFRKAKVEVEARVLQKADGLHVYLQLQSTEPHLEITRTRPVTEAPQSTPQARRIPVGNRTNHR